ncbi:hypothetical protein WJX72_007561 [[Myrmecia] bisecta]|uniref:Uncharacterized protein n=1 Tax=[Myrmecia] bisecta TaxID=41462 RepID=A0AAW1R7G0_9CHLO
MSLDHFNSSQQPAFPSDPTEGDYELLPRTHPACLRNFGADRSPRKPSDESDTSAIQGVLSYEYTADEAFIVADLGRAGAIEEPTVACVAQAITHEYDSAAAAVRDVHGIAMWSNSAQEDSVLTALADLCGPQQFAGLYRNMGDGPQYMLFSEVVRPKLSVKAVPPKLSEEDVG